MLDTKSPIKCSTKNHGLALGTLPEPPYLHSISTTTNERLSRYHSSGEGSVWNPLWASYPEPSQLQAC